MVAGKRRLPLSRCQYRGTDTHSSSANWARQRVVPQRTYALGPFLWKRGLVNLAGQVGESNRPHGAVAAPRCLWRRATSPCPRTPSLCPLLRGVPAVPAGVMLGLAGVWAKMV